MLSQTSVTTAWEAITKMLDIFSAKLGDLRLWSIGLASVVALLQPKAFAWMSPSLVQWLLFVLFFLTGVTAEPADFQACLRRPRPIFINIGACFVMVPLLAMVLGKTMGLSPGLVAGMVLIGSVNGGASSSLFTLLAGGDMALSVVMTTISTVVAVVATPFAVQTLLGTTVPVNAQFVLLPIFLGVSANAVMPCICAWLKPAIPMLVGTLAVPISGAVVVGGAGPMFSGGLPLHVAVILLHSCSGALGYQLGKVSGGSEQECRTLAFTVAVKHVALASVLASAYFQDPSVQVPSAASCIWCPILCSALANYWKSNPIALDAGKKGDCQGYFDDNSWVKQYYTGMYLSGSCKVNIEGVICGKGYCMGP
mmetsp:Transcript_145241/g.253488  ORF Transcript_145241/g.253488 Transcript_145241/m.253488 type:complete len:367 (-) Transcript_145241:77-1177(-)